MINLQSQPHRRLNLLTGEWVLVSPHRTQRPWQGQVEALPSQGLVQHDPKCYLCPGSERAGGKRNPEYKSTFVFDNDFAALLPDTPVGLGGGNPLLRVETQAGICRVICFSPRHDLTLADMETSAIRGVVDTWVEQWNDLNAREQIRYVQIFENRGEMMGSSNPHPHGQIWSISSLPNEILKEDRSQREHRQAKSATLLSDYIAAELDAGERIVCQNGSFVCMVPFWAIWPFETMVISRRPVETLDELSDEERTDLAGILKSITSRYNKLFQVAFPYSMGFHQRPKGIDKNHWHFHAHFYPPLLRSATVRKFMVGFELLAMPQRDITPELAADRLRQMPE